MFSKIFFYTFLGFNFIAAINGKKPKIIEGDYATPGQFPHQVSLQYRTTKDCTFHYCGGTIIDAWHIITAAHCLTDDVTFEFLDIPWTVVAGTTDLTNRTIAVYHDVQFVFIPTNYTLNSHRNYTHDIAVLRLRRPLPLGIHPYLAPILLPRADQYLPPDNQTAVMSGFGVYNETDDPLTGDLISGPISPYLRFAYGIINIPDWNGCLDTQVCVASLGLLDGGYLEGICMGDSGGPLFDEENRTLIGVTSHYNYRECGNIGRFTRVSAYLDFLADVILDNYDIPEIIWQELYHDLEGSFPGLPVCEN